MPFLTNNNPNTNQDEERHFFSVVATGVSYWGEVRRFLGNRFFRNDFQQLCRRRGDASKLVQILNKCIAPFQRENQELVREIQEIARENQHLVRENQHLAFQRERELAEANDSCRRLHTANLELKESLQLQRPNVALLDEQNANSVMQIERGENDMAPSCCNVSNVSPCDESMCSHDADSDDDSMTGLQAVAIPKDLASDINKILRENRSIKSQLREYQNSYEILRLELQVQTEAGYIEEMLNELRDRLRRFNRAYETSPNTQCEDQPISLLMAVKVTTKGGELFESIHRVWNDPENKGMILLDHAIIVDALNLFFKKSNGTIPHFFHCDLIGMIFLILWVGNYRGPGHMVTQELFSPIAKALGIENLGFFGFNWSPYSFTDPTFLSSIVEIPSLVRKVEPYLDEPGNEDIKQSLQLFVDRMERINKNSKLFHDDVVPAVLRVLHKKYFVIAGVDYSNRAGRGIFGDVKNQTQLLSKHLPFAKVCKLRFHLCHVLQESHLTKENFQSLFEVCIVLYAASRKKEVAQIKQDLQDGGPKAKKHLKRLKKIISEFGNPTIRTQQYDTMVEQRRQFTIQCLNSVQPGSGRSNRSIAKQKVTKKVLEKTKSEFGFTWESKELCSHVEEGVQCSNLANSGGLCNHHAGKFCRDVNDEGEKCTNLAQSGGLCNRHAGNYCSHQDEKGVQCTNLAQSGGLCKRHRGKPCSHQDEKGVQCTLLAVKDGLCRRHAGLLCSHQDEKGVQCTNLARSGGFCNRHAGLLCSHQDEKGVQCTLLAIKDGLCRHHSPRVFCSHQDEKGVQCTNLAQSGGICKRHRGKLCSHQDEKGVQCTNLVNSGGLCIRHSPRVFCSHQDEKGEKCTNVARSGCGGLCRRHAGNYCSHVEEGVQCSNLANSGGLCNRHAGNFCSHVDSNGVKCTKLVQKGNLCRGHSRKGNPKDDRDYEYC